MPDQPVANVAIVDYGVGNLFSVQQACAAVGLNAGITSRAADLAAADAVILPGVGAFGAAMDALRALDLVQPIRDVAASGTPLVGICLGLQLFMSGSEEFGGHEGFGFFEGPVVRFPEQRDAEGRILKVPQVGWKPIRSPHGDEAPRTHAADGAAPFDAWPLRGIAQGEYMYFVHSYHARPVAPDAILTVSPYGDAEFCSSVLRGNIFACQFHPERSRAAGLVLYRNVASHIRGIITSRDRLLV